MANTIKIKQSSVASKIPLATDLLQGELAINTIDEKLYTKNSVGDVVELGGSTRTDSSVEITATSGQASFAAPYEVGFVQVYLNGVRLDAADYTATNGTSIVLGVAAAASDVVFIQTFGTFTFAGHYSKTAIDAKIGTDIQAYDADTSKTDIAETRSASIDMADNVIQRPEIKDYSETVQAMAANDVDCTLGNVQTKSISGSVTLTFSNPAVSGKAGSFTLIVTLSGSPAIAWPASVKWSGGTAPTLTTAGIDIFSFVTIDGGTNWFGFVAGQGMS